MSAGAVQVLAVEIAQAPEHLSSLGSNSILDPGIAFILRSTASPDAGIAFIDRQAAGRHGEMV